MLNGKVHNFISAADRELQNDKMMAVRASRGSLVKLSAGLRGARIDSIHNGNLSIRYGTKSIGLYMG